MHETSKPFTDSVRLAGLSLKPGSSMRKAMEAIEANKKGVALVVDGRGALINTITDGDIRRAVLSGRTLDDDLQAVLEVKGRFTHANPITAPSGASRATLLQIMKEKEVRQLPLVNADGKVLDLVVHSDLTTEAGTPIQALIMAGGQGSRLRPHTENLPKPMLPVGGRPLMEIIINQLKDAGIKRVNVSTHYLSDKITDYFKDGSQLGVEINYVEEDHPLGTAGAIRLVEDRDSPILVMNGDVLSGVDFRAMMAFHREHAAHLTVAVRRYEMQVPYGVVECDDAAVRAIREKPMLTFFVNAGIYLIEPSACRHIPSAERLDMPNLIRQMIAKGESVVSFPIVEYWLDIGQPADYEQAKQDVAQGKLSS